MTQTNRMVQHLFQQWEWTDRQGRGIRQPRQWVDQTFPAWRGPALHHSSLPSRRPSISQHWWTLCRCGRCFNVAWTCLVFQITPSVQLSSHHYLFPDMTQPTGDQPRRLDLQKEDPSLQRGSSILLRVPSVLSADGPRRPRDRPGLPWDEPGTTASPGIQDHAPHSPDPRQWSPQHEMSLHSTSMQRWTWIPRAISKDEDGEGDSKKISAAQYEIFRQAVTSSNGMYKVNPAKTKRAARASLLDLGDTEVPDRVSWLDQRIAQGLKEDEEVVKTTLSETSNDNTSSFKFFTVKQIFSREPYRLKIHRDALYAPKPLGDHGFIDNKTPSSYHLSHRVCLDTEELARRSAIYASLADSKVASVIEELSPKDERTKLLREKLTIIQEAKVSAVSAGFAAASNLQFLLRDALLRNFNFQPQVLSAVRTALFEGYHVVGPEPKVLQSRVRAIRQADRMTGSSVTFAKQKEVKTSTKTSSKKTAPRLSVFDRLGSPPSTTQRTVTQEPPFWAAAGRARPRPFQGSKKSGKTSSSSATRQRWRVSGGGSPGRLCPALGESAGQMLGHRHRRGWGGHCIPATTSAHPSKHQFPDQEQPTRPSASRRCLADEGSHRVTNVKSLGFYSRLFLVPKKTGDLRPVIDLSTLNRHMVVPHFKMETQGSVRSAIRSQEWTVSIDIRDAYLHVPMHQAVRKYLRFVVNKKVYQFTCLPFGLATSPREFTKLLRPVVSLLRQQGVKLHVYLDDWLIRADTPEEAQLRAQTTIKVLQFLGWIINFEKSDLRPSQDFQFIGMQFNTRRFTVAPLPKMRVKFQSVHQHWMANPNITARDLHRLLGMLVFMASLVRRGRLRLRPVQWWAATAWCQRTGNWSDRIQVPQWVLSEVAWWSSPAVLQGLPLATKETEVTLFTDASSSSWGAQLGSRSTQGQWSASQRSCHMNVLEMQAVIYAVRDFLPHLRYRVVRLMCDNAVTVAYIKNEGGTRSHTLMQMTIRLLKWCDSKAITLVPVHLPGVRNIQADSLSRVGQTLTTEWTMAMESLRPVFAKWGEPQIDMFATFANRRLVKFVSPYPEPRAEWTDAMSMPWDKERGLLYAFPPFKMVPQVLQKIAQSPGVQVILIAQLQPAASWFPELMDLSQEDPIPLFVEGQDLLTQDVCMGGGVTETRPSGRQIFTRGNSQGHSESERSFQGSCQHDVKMPTRIFTTSVWISLVKIRGVL